MVAGGDTDDVLAGSLTDVSGRSRCRVELLTKWTAIHDAVPGSGPSWMARRTILGGRPPAGLKIRWRSRSTTHRRLVDGSPYPSLLWPGSCFCAQHSTFPAPLQDETVWPPFGERLHDVDLSGSP